MSHTLGPIALAGGAGSGAQNLDRLIFLEKHLDLDVGDRNLPQRLDAIEAAAKDWIE